MTNGKAEDCKKLGGKYDSKKEVCILPTGRTLLVLGMMILFLLAGMMIVGGITLYTASEVFNLTTFTWVGSFFVGLLVFVWIWVFIKTATMTTKALENVDE